MKTFIQFVTWPFELSPFVLALAMSCDEDDDSTDMATIEEHLMDLANRLANPAASMSSYSPVLDNINEQAILM